jgi:hypothetical protein
VFLESTTNPADDFGFVSKTPMPPQKIGNIGISGTNLTFDIKAMFEDPDIQGNKTVFLYG